MLAETKKRSEEYRANKGSGAAPVAATTATPTKTQVGSFSF